MKIALIHATAVAIEPIQAAFASTWPDAECANILDDSLSTDRAKTADLTSAMVDRIVALAHYATSLGSDGVLFTCSAFGAAIEQASQAVNIPVLKPNEAMFEAAMSSGNRIAMLYTFEASLAGMQGEFQEEANRHATGASLSSFFVPDAMALLRAGDADNHNRLIAEKATELTGYDAIMLAQFSTSRAAPSVRSVTGTPVLTSPDTAVSKLQSLLLGNASQ